MLRQPRFRAYSAPICSKVEGFEGSLIQKLFKGYIFCFLGVSIGRYVFEQFVRETNLKKKRSVILSQIVFDDVEI